MNSVNDRSVRVSSLTAHFTNDDVTTGDDISYTSSSSSSFDSMKPSNIHVFSASSTLHGFSHIFALHHSTLRRFTWTVAFLTSLTILLYQSSNRVIYYLSYPHVTRLDEVAAGNLTFPAATICNLNEFRFYQITKNDMYHVGQLLGFLNINGSLIKPSFYTDIENMDEHIRPRMREIKRRIDEVTYFRNFSPRGTFDMMEFYERVGHNLSDFLLACNYR
uniref:Uncharacterized protein n=1 Tax=Ciona savignyi TaxID=51511 RepID=H2YK59_CIOSA